ncbi:MAG TPA: DUF4405 domain-containing protein [Bacteroidota bacterium]
MNRNRLFLWLDSAMLLAVLLLESKVLTGVPFHEWLGILIAAVIILHLVFQWSWIEGQARRIFAPGAWRTRINYSLNFGLFACMVAAIVSGIMISEHVFPNSGRSLNDAMSWHALHDNSGHAIMFLIGLHLALNWDWILAVLRGRFRPRPATSSGETGSSLLPRRRIRRPLRAAAMLLIATVIVALGTYGIKRSMSSAGFASNDAYAFTRRPEGVGMMILSPDRNGREQKVRGMQLPDSVNRSRFFAEAGRPSLIHGYPALIATSIIVVLTLVVGRTVLKIHL